MLTSCERLMCGFATSNLLSLYARVAETELDSAKISPRGFMSINIIHGISLGLICHFAMELMALPTDLLFSAIFLPTIMVPFIQISVGAAGEECNLFPNQMKAFNKNFGKILDLLNCICNIAFCVLFFPMKNKFSKSFYPVNIMIVANLFFRCFCNPKVNQPIKRFFANIITGLSS